MQIYSLYPHCDLYYLEKHIFFIAIMYLNQVLVGIDVWELSKQTWAYATQLLRDDIPDWALILHRIHITLLYAWPVILRNRQCLWRVHLYTTWLILLEWFDKKIAKRWHSQRLRNVGWWRNLSLKGSNCLHGR